MNEIATWKIAVFAVVEIAAFTGLFYLVLLIADRIGRWRKQW